MRFVQATLPSDLDSLILVPLGDFHKGNPLHDRPGLTRAIAWIVERPNAYTVLLGDYGEFVTKSSVGEIYNQMEPQEQKKEVIADLAPLRGRVLAVCAGNHDLRIYRDTGLKPAEDIAASLDAPYVEDGTLIWLRFGRYKGRQRSYHVYATHGWAGGKQAGNKLNNLVGIGGHVDADVYLLGHGHVVTPFKKLRLRIDERAGRAKYDTQAFLSCASFLGWGGYAERGGYPPGARGLPRVILEAKERDMEVTM